MSSDSTSARDDGWTEGRWTPRDALVSLQAVRVPPAGSVFWWQGALWYVVAINCTKGTAELVETRWP